jgi:Helicase C-terminal domain
MPGIDFSRLSQGSTSDKATEPRRIFTTLPAKDQKYSYPRDVQSEVWDRWHQVRTQPDLVVKMNTGGGKTVVGLLILKSCLNEGVGPVVYVSPDIYLAGQVRAEAQALGIETTDDPRSGRFLSGKAILVVHLHKLINGMSVFGVAGDSRQPIDVGTVLIDDAHACLTTVEDQFTLRVPNSHGAYNKLLSLFEDDLRSQSPPGLSDLKAGDRSVSLSVPYWAWIDKQATVLNVLHQHRAEDQFKFVWPLVAESLPLCHVAVTADEFEIRPPCYPVERIPSLARAKRRLYLTATLADDSVLVTHFGADPKSISEPITPKTADDLGDRMILTPLETHPGTSEVEIRQFLADQAKRYNVVVIVPSRRRAELWRPYAAAVHDSKSIDAGVDALRRGHVGLVVLINKYDGIDLPHDACRILALDGLPEAYSPLDRIEFLALDETDAMVARQVQRIEQGMGRGVRSNDDYCVVLLLGSRLTQRLHRAGGFARFSAATRAQLTLSRDVADMLHGKPFTELATVISQCLGRDTAWVTASKGALDGIGYDVKDRVSPIAVGQREAFASAELARYNDASRRLQDVIDVTTDRRVRGWLKQQSASYLHAVDPVGAQELQASAQTDNRVVLKPRSGVSYRRLTHTADQAQHAVDAMRSRYSSGGELIIGVAAILDELVPDPDPASVASFEQAMHDMGLHLGFAAQRPERDTGEGPDVLWGLGELEFLIIECKSGVSTDFIARHDVEQLGHSMDWFAAKYDASCDGIPVLVHKTAVLHKAAYHPEGTRILTFARLSELRQAVRQFTEAIADSNGYLDPTRVGAQLAARHLNGKALIDAWSVTPRRKT